MDNEWVRLDEKLDQILTMLHGNDKEWGVIRRVDVLWLLVVKFPLYVAGIVTGAGLTIVLQTAFK